MTGLSGISFLYFFKGSALEHSRSRCMNPNSRPAGADRDKPMRVIAEELDVSDNTLSTWKKAVRESGWMAFRGGADRGPAFDSGVEKGCRAHPVRLGCQRAAIGINMRHAVVGRQAVLIDVVPLFRLLRKGELHRIFRLTSLKY